MPRREAKAATSGRSRAGTGQRLPDAALRVRAVVAHSICPSLTVNTAGPGIGPCPGRPGPAWTASPAAHPAWQTGRAPSLFCRVFFLSFTHRRRRCPRGALGARKKKKNGRVKSSLRPRRRGSRVRRGGRPAVHDRPRAGRGLLRFLVFFFSRGGHFAEARPVRAPSLLFAGVSASQPLSLPSRSTGKRKSGKPAHLTLHTLSLKNIRTRPSACFVSGPEEREEPPQNHSILQPPSLQKTTFHQIVAAAWCSSSCAIWRPSGVSRACTAASTRR
jgi:hypothetical protein